ncbi:ATP-binding protein [Hylemonella gracilis]|uniref:histidine kinase n=1 Tax=Hylemonella gracilis ATCC 19624 TaxID=887062 RepID=F3KWW9_9BURK|nr:ATP-binding protein [Hylemonella gracilis]EGI75756.1 sensor histidine kinase [Hylemonella gracilis ATCC 19624]
MKKPTLPRAMRSLTARVMLILVLATVFIQAASFIAVLAVSARAGRAQMYAFMSADVAFVQRFLRSLPPDQRGIWLKNLDRGYYGFELIQGASPAPRCTHPHATELADSLHAQAGQNLGAVALCAIPDQPFLSLPIDQEQTLLVHFGERPLSLPSLSTGFAYLAVLCLAVMLVAWLAVRQTTRPLSRLATAAKALGRDLHAPPLPENGPVEVARAAHAFNAMQRAIQRHVAERTEILAAISHDLKTPLTRLRLRAENHAPAQQRERFVADIDAMRAMIQDGLDYAESASLREPRQLLNLGPLCEAMAEDMRDAGQNCVCQGEVQPPVHAAPRALRRALQNLLDNAVRYGQQARIRLSEENGQIVIGIEDEGPGIPPDQLERVFDPFLRLEMSRNRDTGGSGLGLSIARNLLRAHGGDVRLSNLTHGGLRAEVRLPPATEQAEGAGDAADNRA